MGFPVASEEVDVSDKLKLSALHRFYLPYMLPRWADWEGKSVGFKNDRWEVVIWPRNPNEALFVEAVDTTLSTMALVLQRLGMVDVQLTAKVADRALDRVDVLVTGHAPAETAQSPQSHEE